MAASGVPRVFDGGPGGAQRRRRVLDRGDGVRRRGGEVVLGLHRHPDAAQLDAARIPSGTGARPPSRPSGPAMMLSTSATSATERASGPTCVRGSPSVPSSPSSSMTPVSGTRPALGLIDARPQKCAGRRTLPPESVPSPHGEPCAAMIAASPPLLPPGVRVRSYGLFVRP